MKNRLHTIAVAGVARMCRRHAVWRELTWLLVLKFAALTLLWWLFFSASHRPRVDGWTAGQRFAVDPPVSAAAPSPPVARKNPTMRCMDNPRGMPRTDAEQANACAKGETSD
jgi:hypothetical protein